MKYLGWFSCGITSAVACKLAIEEYGEENVELYYFVIDSAHPDNERFIRDCEKWYGKEINRIQSEKYTDQFDVIEKTRYVNGPAGARCTLELKKNLRFKLEDEYKDWAGQIFGFEFETKEVNRAIRFSEQYPKAKPVFPLIDNKLTKVMCADILQMNGIELPAMYGLGFHNNNCIGCVKGGKGYWNHVRKIFPDYFERMAKLEREVERSCIREKVFTGEYDSKGKKKMKSQNLYLDQLDPDEGRHAPPIVPNCGAVCQTEFNHIIDPRTEKIMKGEATLIQLKLF
jgi:3'-phosphoadenosine 5'-phosphosulfate sulfotransferase (PAPS reductase)/FAD synthetase